MEPISVSWTETKRHLTAGAQLKWVDADPNYLVYAVDPPFCVMAILPKGSAEATEFETSFQTQILFNNNVTTQYEKNDKDLKLARDGGDIVNVSGQGHLLLSTKVPGVMANGDGRYIAGGYVCLFDFDKDDYAKVRVEDVDRKIAWAIALSMDSGATAPVADAVVQGAGVIPGFGQAFPAYPVIKSYTDDDASAGNQGWYFWPTAMGNSLPPIGECEVEPIGGYGFIPAELYLVMEVVRPNVTTGSVRVDYFWGKRG